MPAFIVHKRLVNTNNNDKEQQQCNKEKQKK